MPERITLHYEVSDNIHPFDRECYGHRAQELSLDHGRHVSVAEAMVRDYIERGDGCSARSYVVEVGPAGPSSPAKPDLGPGLARTEARCADCNALIVWDPHYFGRSGAFVCAEDCGHDALAPVDVYLEWNETWAVEWDNFRRRVLIITEHAEVL